MNTYRFHFSDPQFESMKDVRNCDCIMIECDCYNVYDVEDRLIFSTPLDAVTYVERLPLNVVK